MSGGPTLTEDRPEVLDGTSEPLPPQAERMLMAFRSEQHFISSSDKIAEKLTPEHITQLLASSDKEDEREHARFQWTSIIKLLIFFTALLFAGFLLVFFSNSEYFLTILASIFSFLGGLGFGRFASLSKK